MAELLTGGAFGEAPKPEVIRPTTVQESISAVNELIGELLRKNRTMIDYYIRPKPIPSEIEAYEPNIEVLASRVDALALLHIPSLVQMLDYSPAIVAFSLMPIVDQLCNACIGIQNTFVNHYDRRLEQRKPYDSVYQKLDYKYKQLTQMWNTAVTDPNRRTAESNVMQQPGTSSEPMFCKMAVAFINARDGGRFAQVMSEDLTYEEKERLKVNGGAYLWWECQSCAYKLKYYAPNSQQSSLYVTEDIRGHPEVPEIEYRGLWLVKCHLYLDKSKVRRRNDNQYVYDPPLNSSARRTSMSANDKRPGMSARSKSNAVGTSGRRESDALERRMSDVKSSPKDKSIFSISFGSNIQNRRPSMYTTTTGTNIRSNDRDPIVRFEEAGQFDSNSSSKMVYGKSNYRPGLYGCPFCFVIGCSRGRMDYVSELELIEHIADKHSKRNKLPCSLILEKFAVGIGGKNSEKVRRWDLNIRAEY